jgi:hypothetical protein
LNICNSHTSTIPKVGVHLGIIGLHPLHSPPFVKVCFTPKHIFGPMGLYTSHFVVNPMLGLWQKAWKKLGFWLCTQSAHIAMQLEPLEHNPFI